MTVMVPNRVPAGPIVTLLNEYLEGSGDGISGLAARLAVRHDTLEKISVGRTATLDFDFADRLLCAIDCHDMWRGPLANVYETAVLSEDAERRPPSRTDGKRTCERRGCSVQFVPSKHKPAQRFCSNACRSAAWKHKRGLKSIPRGPGRSLEAFVCRNGHERTPENTGRNSRGHRYCLICHRDSMRRQRPKKAAA